MAYMPDWILPVLLAAAFVSGLVGGLIGRKLFKKHFERAASCDEARDAGEHGTEAWHFSRSAHQAGTACVDRCLCARRLLRRGDAVGDDRAVGGAAAAFPRGGSFRGAFLYVLIFGVSLWLEMVALARLEGLANFLAVTIVGIFLRFTPSLAMGYITMSTTTVSEFLAAMARLHLLSRWRSRWR